MRRRVPQRVAGALLLVALLGGCSVTAVATPAPSPTGGGAADTATDRAPHPPAAGPTPTPPPADHGSVTVIPYREPGDHAHRNYCGAGAATVLLSAWLGRQPDIEEVARRSHLDPATGVTTSGVLDGVNSYLDPITVPVTGSSWYRAERIASVALFESRLRRDLGGSEPRARFGHAAPVMVSAMTRPMPHWDGWPATHMVTIYALDLRPGDPARDTVTYTETPSYAAGYHGSGVETATVATLWVAMQAYLAYDTREPFNVID
jgi:hypothetical protein